MPLASCRRCLRKESEAQGGLAVRLGRAFSPRLWFNQGTWGYAPGCDVPGRWPCLWFVHVARASAETILRLAHPLMTRKPS